MQKWTVLARDESEDVLEDHEGHQAQVDEVDGHVGQGADERNFAVAAGFGALLGGLFFGGSGTCWLVFGAGGHEIIVVFKWWWAKRLAEVGLGSPGLLRIFVARRSG